MLSSLVLMCMLVSSVDGTATETIDSPLLISDSAELARLRNEVLKWSNSLKSFKGFYSLRQQNYIHPNGNVTPEALYEMEIEYKFQNDNRYMALEMFEPDGTLTRLYAAQLDGVVKRRDDMNLGTEEESRLLLLQESSWPFPNGAYLLPTDLFGGDSGKTLEERFQEGTTYLLKRDGMPVLFHSNPADPFEIYIDEQGKVRRIDTLLRPAISLEELKTKWGEEEPFNVFLRIYSLELDGYMNIDGVDFPTLATQSTRLYDKEEYRVKCKEPFRGKEISIFEMHMRTMKLPLYLSTVMDFRLDTSAVEINKSLKDREFKFALEDGMEVFENTETTSYVYKTPWYARPITWGIAVAVLLLLGGGGIFWYVQRPA